MSSTCGVRGGVFDLDRLGRCIWRGLLLFFVFGCGMVAGSWRSEERHAELHRECDKLSEQTEAVVRVGRRQVALMQKMLEEK